MYCTFTSYRQTFSNFVIKLDPIEPKIESSHVGDKDIWQAEQIRDASQFTCHPSRDSKDQTCRNLHAVPDQANDQQREAAFL